MLQTPTEASFATPLALLHACHERVESRLVLLDRLVRHVEQNGVDRSAKEAAGNILRYFDEAAPHHHGDEEDGLFPLLSEAAVGTELRAVETLQVRIREDHAVMAALWQQLRAQLAGLTESEQAILDVALIDRFATTYRAHIRLEEDQLFPLARRMLGDEALEALGDGMALRRGVRS